MAVTHVVSPKVVSDSSSSQTYLYYDASSADNVSEGKRVSTFRFLFGVISAGTVFGTLAAQLLPPTKIFQVAAVVSVVAVVYMRFFLQETPQHYSRAVDLEVGD